MTDWSTVFLGVIAVSSLLVALIQVGVLIAAMKVARTATASLNRVEAQFAPLVRRAEVIGNQTSEALVRVVAGIERTERLVDTVEHKVGRASEVVTERLRAPVGEVSAVVAGVRAAASTLGRKVAERLDDGPEVRVLSGHVNGHPTDDDDPTRSV